MHQSRAQRPAAHLGREEGWDEIKGQNRKTVVEDPNQWPALFTMEIILATAMIMVIDECFSVTFLLLDHNFVAGETDWNQTIGGQLLHACYYVGITWYSWLLVKNILLMLIHYIVSSYYPTGGEIRSRYSFVAGLLAAIGITLLFQNILSGVALTTEAEAEELSRTILLVKVAAGLTLVSLATSVYTHYGFGLWKAKASNS